jgi:hypothetical protein
VCELDDVLAEIRFDDLHSRGFERVVQVRLFGRHALALNDGARVSVARQAHDDVVRLGGVAGPMDYGTALLRVRRKRFEILVEVQQHFVLDRAGLGAQVFPVAETASGFETAFAEQRRGLTQRAAQLGVRQRGLRIVAKRFAA